MIWFNLRNENYFGSKKVEESFVIDHSSFTKRYCIIDHYVGWFLVNENKRGYGLFFARCV